MKKCLLLGILFLTGINVFAQNEVNKGLSAITESAIKGQLEFLASDWTEGRAADTKGAYLAADYIASMFKVYGIEPYGDMDVNIPSRSMRRTGLPVAANKTYFQNFSLIKIIPTNDQQLSIITNSNGSEKAVQFNYRTDFDVRSVYIGLSGNAPLVFIGYGISDKEKAYDELNKIDLKGKIAVMVSGFPGYKDTASVAYKKFRLAQRIIPRRNSNIFEDIAKMGAMAVIQAGSDGSVLNWAKNQIYPVHGDYYEADSLLKSYSEYRMILPADTLSDDIPVYTVTKRVLNSILDGTGINLDEFDENAKTSMKPASRILAGKSMSFKTTVLSEIVKVRNVVGIIEGEKKDEFIVVGGHYDHLGKYNGFTWNGADDNASGTVGVMTLAKAIMATGKKPEKSIIFAGWTAEEKGLYGSQYFVREAKKEGKNIVLNLNYDMIARNTESDSLGNLASMDYTEAFPGIREATEKNIKDHNINLSITYKPSNQPGGGSDHAPFAKVGIPVFYFMAAMHPDYHQPSDEVAKVNWKKMTDIIRIGFLNTWEFANSDKYLQVKDIKSEEIRK